MSRKHPQLTDGHLRHAAIVTQDHIDLHYGRASAVTKSVTRERQTIDPVHARITTPAPMDLFISYRKLPPSPLNWLKAARAAMVWRAHSGLSSITIFARLFGWLFRFPSDVVRFMYISSGVWIRQFHRSRLQQFGDLIFAASVNGLMPRDYYRCDIARFERKGSFFDVIPYQLYATPLQVLSRCRGTSHLKMVRNKSAFYEHCKATGLPVPNSFYTLTENQDASGTLRLPPSDDFIIKPAIGSQGKGIAIWRHCPAARSWESSGRSRDAKALVSELSALAAATPGGLILQEVLINNAAIEPFAPFALSTFRTVTIMNENGDPEVVVSQFRTATKQGSAVDNFHAGGCLFHVDLANGVFGKGEQGDYSARPVSWERHPANGSRVSGAPVPQLAEICALAKRAHSTLPELLCVGWDIANTSRGLVIVEANVPPGLQPSQQVQMRGFATTRFMQLLSHHCKKWIEENEGPSSRFRVSAGRPKA